MEYFFLLTIFTAIIVVNAWILWVRTRSISFPLGIAFLYYWSLYGAWSIVTDKLGGDSGKHFEYLEQKLFAIDLDDRYLQTLILYAVFIFLIEVALLFFVNRPQKQPKTAASPLRLSHAALLVIALSSGVMSYLIIRPEMLQASDVGMSAYSVTRLSESPFLTIHQLLNRVALISIALGLAVLCSGRKPRLVCGERGTLTALCYAGVTGCLLWFAFVLGNKSEVFLSGVAGCLFYLANAQKPRIGVLAVTALAGMTVLWITDLLRAVPQELLASALSNLKFDDLMGVLQFTSSNSELAAAHYSMYGALDFNIAPTYGSSFVSLLVSAVPRLLLPERPEDIYAYYAQQVNVLPGQGYTIHHATGWFLNFGVIGMICGAVVMGLVWAKCFNANLALRSDGPRWRRVLGTLAPWMFVACLPALIRTGPEGYKALVVEGFAIPTLLITLVSFRPQTLFRSAEVRNKRAAAPKVRLAGNQS